MTERVETREEFRRGVIGELVDLTGKALKRISDLVAESKWDQAIGALGTLKYVLEAARDFQEAST